MSDFYDVIPRAFVPVEVECGRDDELDPRQTDNSDGHLEDDDYWRRHPEEER